MRRRYSSIWLARRVEHLVTLEINPKYAAIAQENLAAAQLTDRVDLRVGPALDSLSALVREGSPPFDMIFIDADKQNNKAYFEASLTLSRPGTVIIVDNVVRNGAVVDADNEDPRVQGVRSLVDALSQEPRLRGATALQTVGAKGYDGFIMAVVGEA